ncbi:hypothetical protein VitviT2T_023628 [Vitis vinifera]|uniref:NAC domain-containing protein n=1 Tax=Vitis vinifera TaxID=29760 RepID=A0ABY9DDC4_VITVI|nr:hypothetical protein VitviT2T_023628 [Vitis vinifera]
MSTKEEILRIFELLPVGYGFRPTDEELVYHYLKSKILGTESHEGIIPVIEAYKMDPWFISGSCLLLSEIQTDGPEYFFFCPLHPMFPNRNRVRRRTTTGYWAKTGPDSESKGEATEEVIGTKKTFVFKMHGDRDRGVADINTGWVIHEYSACMDSAPANKTLVLCRLKTNRVWFSPTINNGKLPKQLSNQETWPMNMDVDDSSTDTGFHLNGPPNIMGWGNALPDRPPSYDLATDSDACLYKELTPQMRSAVDSGETISPTWVTKWREPKLGRQLVKLHFIMSVHHDKIASKSNLAMNYSCFLLSEIQTYGPEWFFFSPLYKKYRKRNQLQRTTNVGYWKPTGPARDIKRGVTEEVIGTKKTLVFHMGGGHGHADVTTGWVIHE